MRRTFTKNPRLCDSEHSIGGTDRGVKRVAGLTAQHPSRRQTVVAALPFGNSDFLVRAEKRLYERVVLGLNSRASVPVEASFDEFVLRFHVSHCTDYNGAHP